ncbi:phage integrase SAM-like domain-containing protein [Bacteroidetes bacterium endosymbiont of Geopemphigus sp.]|uniref:phage integrase SAM-like domain-containing protein n=1 Tax=Bacteroidetes bacterium endosymbiont of Geopemphigus sp. TaxID=2047937 RepID=UPI0018A822A4
MLKAFQEYKNIQLKFTDINLAFHKEFIEYLRKLKKLGSSSVWEAIKNLKALGRVDKLEGHRVHEEFENRESSPKNFLFKSGKCLPEQ